MLNVFVKCTHEHTCRLAVMNEAHIHVQHGTSLRKDICALRDYYFGCIQCNQLHNFHPRLFTLTAMFPGSYVRLLLTLLTIDLNIGDCIVRGSSLKFHQQEINMHLVICSNKAPFVGKGLMLDTDFLD